RFQPLALNYVRRFLDRPMAAVEALDPDYGYDKLRRLAEANSDSEGLSPLRHIIVYDELAAKLHASVSEAYVEMLDAEASYETAESNGDRAKAREKRTAKAKEIIAAWRSFDDEIRANPWLRGTTARLGAFTLNDAILSQALWFDSHPDLARPAPR